MSRRRRRGGLRALAITIAAALVLVVATAALTFRWARDAGSAPTEPVSFEVQPGEGLASAAARLEARGGLDSAWRLSLYAWMTGGGPIEEGRHLLPGRLTPAELLACLRRGRGRPIARLTIPEGFDRYQVAERLESLHVVSAVAFSRAATDSVLLSELGVPGPSAEGYLFPATYQLYVNERPTSVLERLVREAKKRQARIAAASAGALAELEELHGWTMHEVVTLASIVEKEAADPSEHGPIASVFHNRLQDDRFQPRHRLQSDPTAAYGCRILGDALESCRGFSGAVTAGMLRDGNNPYNTYRHAGLPPGPISNPGESAIAAALQPPVTPYFFFVSQDGKRHVFTRTLAEHRKAISGMRAN